VDIEKVARGPRRACRGGEGLSEAADGFREWRSETGVGPAIINMEVGVIRRMLKRARRWHQLGADIRPLKEPRSIGRALTYEEKLRLLRAAGLNDEWQRAQAAMSLALCTTMRGCEIKRLQWRDIDFLNRAILVRTSKTEAGERLIPMNDETLEIVMRLRERAKGFNGTEAQHYVFPACEHGHVDPTHNQTSFRTAWRTLTKAAGLAGLRFHDLRHHASPNWPNHRLPIKPSWRLLVTSARRCWPATRMCVRRRDGRR
jgi:integrase